MLLLKKMQSPLKLFLILFSIQIIFLNPSHADEINYRNEYLVDTRGDDGDILLSRVSFHKRLDSSDIDISFFTEGQRSLEINDWEKVMLGMECGKYLWEYLYIGQTIQVSSGQIFDYLAFDTDSKTIDATTKIGLQFPLSEKVSFSIFEEYTLNPIKGRDEYCEAGAEAVYRPKKSLSFGIGWRHTDRIHALDTDYVSTSFTLHF